MRPPARAAALVLGAMVLGNAAYALGVPAVLDALLPEMPLGYREGASPETDARASFVDVTERSGIRYARFLWDQGELPYPAVLGGGVAAGDVDADGWVDLYFPPGGPGFPPKLYRNLGNFSFDDVTARAGLLAEGFGAGASFGDFDNDGRSDLYVLLEDRGILYRNEGAGRFADVTASAGAGLAGACGERPCLGSGVAWLDYDRDGLLDLYVVNNLDWRRPGLHSSGEDYSSLVYFAPAQDAVLLRNLGGGRFADATRAAGAENTGKGLGVAVADVDRNGWPDLATANDVSENALYLNHNGTFRNVARAAGVNEVKTSMGIVAGDLDGDGRADLAVSNFRGHRLSLFLQRADGTFTYATEERGLAASWRGTGWGLALTDVDLDGWLDLAEGVGRAVPLAPHRADLHNVLFAEWVEDSADELFRNLGNGYFAEATRSAGAFAGTTTTRALLAVDLDNDGDEDLVRVNLQGEPAEVLRNDARHPHHGVQLDLEGTRSNRDGFGAVVRLALPDGRVLVREASSSGGYQTGLSPVLTVGLGRSEEARVEVAWPSGLVEDFGTLAAGQRARLVEGAARAAG